MKATSAEASPEGVSPEKASPEKASSVAVVCGGVGAARFLRGLVQVADPASCTAVVNVGDDAEMHGLRICPDLDTVCYTLAGRSDPERGWGLAGETWQAMDQLELYGGPAWFRLGDRDLGTHLFRTGRLAAGAGLSQVTAEIAAALGVGVRLLPATEDRLRTRLELASGEEVDFQEYFVRLRHGVPVRSVRFEGAEKATPAPGVLEALEGAGALVIAPSNPAVSIAPVLAVPGIAATLERRRREVVAVSPIVGGRALKGPADRLLVELGGEASVVGVARALAHVAGTLVVDEVDAELAGAVEAEGLACVVTSTVMSSPEIAAALARRVIEEARGAR